MPYKPKNSRYWYASYKDARGKRVRISTETENYGQAAALEGKWKADVWRQQHWGERPRYTFEALIESYLDATEYKASNERDMYAAQALGPHFVGKVVADISAQDVADYKKARLQQVSVGTLIKELGLLSAAINYANTEWDWRLPNVVAGRIPPAPKGRIRWLTTDEVHRLLRAAERPRGASYLADMIRLALQTGMRHRELLNLTWQRIDWQQRLIYFEPDDHKARRQDTVPINQSAIAVLQARWAHRPSTYTTRSGKTIAADTSHVFTFRGKAIASAKKSFASACAAAGIDDCTIHDLRHTFASRLVQASVPIVSVKEVMRHRSIQTTMRYAHLAPENTRAAVDALAMYDQSQTHPSPKQAISDQS